VGDYEDDGGGSRREIIELREQIRLLTGVVNEQVKLNAVMQNEFSRLSAEALVLRSCVLAAARKNPEIRQAIQAVLSRPTASTVPELASNPDFLVAVDKFREAVLRDIAGLTSRPRLISGPRNLTFIRSTPRQTC